MNLSVFMILLSISLFMIYSWFIYSITYELLIIEWYTWFPTWFPWLPSTYFSRAYEFMIDSLDYDPIDFSFHEYAWISLNYMILTSIAYEPILALIFTSSYDLNMKIPSMWIWLNYEGWLKTLLWHELQEWKAFAHVTSKLRNELILWWIFLFTSYVLQVMLRGSW